MSQKEVDRYDIIQQLKRKEINRIKAAQLLQLCARQISRLKQKVIDSGAKGLIHGNRGADSHNRIPEGEEEKIKKLLHDHYADFKPGFATEKLEERHKIDRDSKTIRRIMIAEGLWKPRKATSGTEHRAWRPRKDCFGEMQQFDGSYHYWFENRGHEHCLLASVDDATGKITKAKFDEHEGVVPVFAFWKEYILAHGKPRTIYTDKFSTYKMNTSTAIANPDVKTQFGRACMDLGIEPIFANSPQAKGRIERLFETLQDRLVKELRLENMHTTEEANRYLEEVFIPAYNAKFAVVPAADANLHRKLPAKEEKTLDAIFSRQYPRTVQNDFTLSYKNQWYQLLKEQSVTVRKKERVVIEERLDGSAHIRLRDKYLNYKLLPARPKKAIPDLWVLEASKNPVSYKPPADHPWRAMHLQKHLVPVKNNLIQCAAINDGIAR